MNEWGHPHVNWQTIALLCDTLFGLDVLLFRDDIKFACKFTVRPWTRQISTVEVSLEI